MRGWMGAAAVGAALAGVGGVTGCLAETFTCSRDSECGAGGLCEFNGYCSFADPECDSGRRFGDLANEGVAGLCVPQDTGTGTTGMPGSGTGASGSPTAGGPDVSSGTMAGWTTADPTSAETTTGPTTDPTLDPTLDPTRDPTTDPTTVGDDSTGDSAARVEDGVVVLYRFAGGAGTTIADSAPTEPALPLTLSGTGSSWTSQGLVFTGDAGTIASASGSTTKINQACSASQAITLESWVTPGMVRAVGPTRVLTYSVDPALRNFTLGQGQDFEAPAHGWQARLRTTATDLNGLPGLATHDPVVVGQPTHLVFTRESSGAESFFVDDVLISTASRAGDFSTWATDGSMALAVGNEISLDRPYTGEIHLAAVYCRALSAAEVSQNFAAGY